MEAVGRNEKVLRGRTALQGPLNGVTVRTGAPLRSFGSQNQPPPRRLRVYTSSVEAASDHSRARWARAAGKADFQPGYRRNAT